MVDVMDSLRGSIVAILRASRADRFVEISHALVDAGLHGIEVTLTSDGALDALAQLAAELPGEVILGAGTVLDTAQAEAAVEAGASFLVSPTVSLDVIQRGRELGVAVFPGAATPTEVFQAWRGGATAVKVFPASLLGGPDYIRALRGPLPDIPLIPTGGIDLQSARTYLEAGSTAIGMGRPLIGDAAAGGDLELLRERTRLLLRELS